MELKSLMNLKALPWVSKPKGEWVFEVGNPVLKGAYCLKTHRTLQFRKIVTELLPANPKDALTAFFQKLAQTPEGTSPVWVFVARNLTTFRQMELPSTEQKELTAMADLQIGKQTPYNREEIVVDWQAVPSKRAGFSTVNMAIVHCLALTSYLEALKDSGFEIEKVGLVSSGLPFFVSPDTGPSAEKLLILVDEFYTEFQIIASEKNREDVPQILFSRAIPFGGARLSETGTDAWEKLIAEVKRSLEIVQNEQLLSALPERALLLGASRHLSALSSRLSQDLNLSCSILETMEPLLKFSDEARAEMKTQQETKSFHALLASAALSAESHFDLMPTDLKLRRSLKDRTREIIRLGVMLGAVVMLATGFFFGKIYKKSFVLQSLEKRYEQSADGAKQVNDLRDILSRIHQRASHEGSALHFLDMIHQVTPQDIYYTHVSFEEGKSISLRGYAKVTSSVFNFVTELDKISPFKAIETKYATRRKIKEEELVEFEVAGRFGAVAR